VLLVIFLGLALRSDVGVEALEHPEGLALPPCDRAFEHRDYGMLHALVGGEMSSVPSSARRSRLPEKTKPLFSGAFCSIT
jgi:hypothetical protein